MQEQGSALPEKGSRPYEGAYAISIDWLIGSDSISAIPLIVTFADSFDFHIFFRVIIKVQELYDLSAATYDLSVIQSTHSTH